MTKGWCRTDLWVALGWLVAHSAQAAPLQKIGVFDISVVGFDPGLSQTAIDALATAVSGVEGFEVVSRSDLDTMLGAEQLKDAVGCDDVSCLAEIGAAAGVARVIGGSISKLDEAAVVSLQLVNTHYATVENRVTLTWEGPLLQLPNLLGAGAELLIIPARDRKKGGLVVRGVPAEAAVSVDGQLKGSGPLRVDELAVGVHTFTIEAEDFIPHKGAFVVRNGATTTVNSSLEPQPEEGLTSKWWFWTGAGVLAAGAAAGTYLLLSGNSNDKRDVTFVAPAP